jgi:hypothetical protein
MDFKDDKYILLIYYYIISYYNYYKRLHLLSIVVKIVVRNLLSVRLTYYFSNKAEVKNKSFLSDYIFAYNPSWATFTFVPVYRIAFCSDVKTPICTF